MEKKITAPALQAGRKQWFALAILALPTLLVAIDLFVVLLAVPRMSEALHASSTQQLWILDMYGFMVAGFLITMGTLGDRIGRRKLLLIGALLFSIASVSAAFSTSPAMVIASRALLGIAGAALTPSTLSLISVMFQDAKQRTQAIGIWAACFTLGAIIGPLVGGLLLQRFWWGSVFLIGVPVMILLLILGPIFLPEYKAPKAARLDSLSVVLSLAAILPVVYGLKELARSGWQILPVAAIVFGVIMGISFIKRQSKLTDPLLDLQLFRNRNLSMTVASLWLFSMMSGGTMVFVGQHLQFVESLSPLRAGIAMIPAMVASVISFQIAPLLARKIRASYLIGGGLLVTVIGFLILAQSGTATGLWPLVVGLAVASMGGAPLVTLGTHLVISAAPMEKAGSAAAVAQTANESGLAFGVAFLGSIMTLTYHSSIAKHLPAGLSEANASAAHDNIASALIVAAGLPAKIGNSLTTAAGNAFTGGLHAVVVVGALALVCTAVMVIRFLNVPAPQEAETQSAE